MFIFMIYKVISYIDMHGLFTVIHRIPIQCFQFYTAIYTLD